MVANKKYVARLLPFVANKLHVLDFIQETWEASCGRRFILCTILYLAKNCMGASLPLASGLHGTRRIRTLGPELARIVRRGWQSERCTRTKPFELRCKNSWSTVGKFRQGTLSAYTYLREAYLSNLEALWVCACIIHAADLLVNVCRSTVEQIKYNDGTDKHAR